MNTTKLTTKQKHCSKTELANAYGVSVKTLSKWIRRVVDTGRRKILLPFEIALIEAELGKP
ncbi:MAG: hypothetical protein U0V72_00615 [Cytophagales bacterium]